MAGSLESSKLKPSSIVSDQQLVQQILDRITDYMLRYNLSINQLYNEMDVNKYKQINLQNLNDFLFQKFNMSLSQDQLAIFFRSIDQSNDKNISIQELLNAIRARGLQRKSGDSAEFNKLFGEQKYTYQSKNVQQYLQEIARYMVVNNIRIPELFQLIDKDQSGTINKQEMKSIFLKQIQTGINDQTFDEFFSHFDTNKSNSVSITEFVNALKPILQ